MIDWNYDLTQAPKDRPIMVFHDHDADIYYENRDYQRITVYACHVEGLSHSPGCGIFTAVWGGGVDEDESGEGWGPRTCIPDYWFEINSDFELPLNPIAWAEIDLPKNYLTQYETHHRIKIQRIFEISDPDPVHTREIEYSIATPAFVINPTIVTKNKKEQWFFYDETWANAYGPYDSEYLARYELLKYSQYLKQENTNATSQNNS